MSMKYFWMSCIEHSTKIIILLEIPVILSNFLSDVFVFAHTGGAWMV